MVSLGDSNGYRVFQGSDLSTFQDNEFDLIVAFDVLEHLQNTELDLLLKEVSTKLKDGGLFLARFPNGDSPFSSFIQNGDPTHVNCIGSMKMKYFAHSASMRLLKMGGEAQPIFNVGLIRATHRIIARPIKIVFNLLLRLLFAPSTSIDFVSRNSVVVLQTLKTKVN